MNCRKTEEKIYLYTELTSSEKKIVDEHLQHCDACRMLARQFFQVHEVVKKAARHTPELRNPHSLTQHIMMAIENEKSRFSFSAWFDYMDNLFVRYAISAVSVFLISFFVYEQQAADVSASMRRPYKSEISKGAVLDYGKFRNIYFKRKESKPIADLSSRYAYYKSEQVGIKR
jgi:predicted anti-sigma-YlaC factor YlaD